MLMLKCQRSHRRRPEMRQRCPVKSHLLHIGTISVRFLSGEQRLDLLLLDERAHGFGRQQGCKKFQQVAQLFFAINAQGMQFFIRCGV